MSPVVVVLLLVVLVSSGGSVCCGDRRPWHLEHRLEEVWVACSDGVVVLVVLVPVRR